VPANSWKRAVSQPSLPSRACYCKQLDNAFPSLAIDKQEIKQGVAFNHWAVSLAPNGTEKLHYRARYLCSGTQVLTAGRGTRKEGSCGSAAHRQIAASPAQVPQTLLPSTSVIPMDDAEKYRGTRYSTRTRLFRGRGRFSTRKSWHVCGACPACRNEA
jgi:hypothetical protein